VLTAAAALSVVLAGAAAADLPITGAFGLEFDEPVPPALLGASLAEPPYPVPPGNLEQAVPESVPGQLDGWYLFNPVAAPDLLSGPEVRYYVLRGHDGFPVRILAEHAAPECIDDVLWLTRSLSRKYEADADPFGAERTGFRQSARFVSDRGQIDVSCGPTLLVEYTDPAGYRRWLDQQHERLAARTAAADELDAERSLLERARLRELAEAFTQGDRLSLDGAFGIPFGEAVPDAWLADASAFLPDEVVPARPPEVPDALADGDYTITLGPDRLPIRIAAEFPDPDASRFERLAGALAQKYGPPTKNADRHRIHKVSGDYLVARHVAGSGMARLVFIDDVGRDGQRARQAAAQAERLAEQQRQFEEETAGL
tara:strand:- start:2016 stop:3128 length:1113 start_codon:yes stop_codon:yes gene_type:complete